MILVLDDMTSISFIKHLKQVTPAEREDELTKKISVSKDIIAKLLELVKKADKNNKDLVQQLNEGTYNASIFLSQKCFRNFFPWSDSKI
jgi:hypothetical protein